MSRGFFYDGPVPEKTQCPRCTGPIGERPARSQLRYDNRRPITVCPECATEEWAIVKDGRTPVSDEAWPVRKPPPVRVKFSDDFRVEVDGDNMTMDGTISGDIAGIVEREIAKGRTMDDVMNEVLKSGIEGLKAIYGDD